MTPLSGPILTADQMRAAEMAAGVPLSVLMERAGAAVAEAVWRYGGGQETLIACGPGNNGGDGYVAARLLKARGMDVRVAALGEPRTELAQAALARWDGPVEDFYNAAPAPLFVDALFGTGLTRNLDRRIAARIEELCTCANFSIAVDLPSGAGTDDGADLGLPEEGAWFNLILALGAYKPAHFLFPAADYCPQIKLVDIGLWDQNPCRTAIASLLTQGYRNTIPEWRSHKYHRAVCVVGGDMPGAAQLAACAAAPIAGITLLATDSVQPNPVASIIQRPLIDVMADIRFKTFVIGPGLGTGPAARAKLEALLGHDCSLVIDADALTLLADIGLDAVRDRKGETILTPHEGEFNRVFGTLSGSKIDRAREARERANASVIYKGADTVIATHFKRRPILAGDMLVLPPASPWLASAGTGDVLAGLVGAFMACGDPQGTGIGFAYAAPWAGPVLHRQIAELIGPGLMADDMPRFIRHAMKANGYV